MRSENQEQKIMIGIPYHSGMGPKFHLSIINLGHYLSTHGYKVDIFYSEGTLLAFQRNKAAKAAKDGGFDLLFLDTDMVFTPQDALKLMEVKADIVGGIYYSRRYPYYPIVYIDDLVSTEGKFRSIAPGDITKEPFKCAGLGAGFLFIRHGALIKLFDSDLGLPFNHIDTKTGDQLGEDLSFFHRCNQLGIDIFCVSDVNVGHLSEKVITRQEYLMAVERDYHYCNDIQGWMTVREQNWLYSMAKQMNMIVEVGSWKGKATHALCSGCPGQVVAVDHFKGSEAERENPHREAVERDISEDFMKNVGSRFSNVRVLKMSSIEAAQIVANRDEKPDMVFIDAGHTENEVMADLEAWEPLTKRLICGHDYTNIEGVQKAVNKYFGGMENLKIFESIWAFEK